MSENKPLILERLAAIQKAVPAIGKNRQNTQQGYNFRSIDDVIDRLHGLFADNQVILSPSVTESVREKVERQGKMPMTQVAIKVEYTFTCAEDGSVHKVGPVIGEAMDLGDKASAKAMTMATKTMLCQVFMIAFQDIYDTDQHSTNPDTPTSNMLTKEQAEQIMGLLEQLDNKVQGGFLSWAGVASVPEIPQDKFATALGLLQAKVANMQKGAAK